MYSQRISHRRQPHTHIYEYLILFLLVTTGFLGLFRLTGQPLLQLRIGVITGLAYICWGIFHHLCNRDLNWKVVVEYSAIGGFGIALLWALLFLLY